jgi:hypothetical protein
MQINKLKEAIREAIDKVLSENQPAVKEPITKPAKPTTKPGPFSPDKDKNNIPKVIPAKATGLKEEEMLQKIVARFKSKK